jgi:hypothetical protein
MGLQVLDAVACMACLRCDKSYREVVVLLTHSYFNNLSIVGSPHSCIIVPEITTERLEVWNFFPTVLGYNKCN